MAVAVGEVGTGRRWLGRTVSSEFHWPLASEAGRGWGGKSQGWFLVLV
jgi:hypothetical protein